MKNMTTCSAILAILGLATTAAADPEMDTDAVRRAGILAVLQPPVASVSWPVPVATPAAFASTKQSGIGASSSFCRAGETCEARGTVPWARPLFHSVGGCDEQSLSDLAHEIGRLGAFEQCTARGAPGPLARPLHRPAPRSAFAPRRNVGDDPLAGLENL